MPFLFQRKTRGEGLFVAAQRNMVAVTDTNTWEQSRNCRTAARLESQQKGESCN
jgi:hypothetical protein